VQLEFSGEIWYWRGPAPFHFVSLPTDDAALVKEISKDVTYGWGMIPVTATIGATTWTTSMFAKHGTYVVPLKDRIRAAEELDVGDVVTVRVTVG
jgi:hypothetical protein